MENALTKNPALGAKYTSDLYQLKRLKPNNLLKENNYNPLTLSQLRVMPSNRLLITSSCPQTKINDNPTNFGVTRNQHESI